jgi:hypothetical protein
MHTTFGLAQKLTTHVLAGDSDSMDNLAISVVFLNGILFLLFDRAHLSVVALYARDVGWIVGALFVIARFSHWVYRRLRRRSPSDDSSTTA